MFSDFSPSQFKRWMKTHIEKEEMHEDKWIGCEVESRVSLRRISEKMESDEPDTESLANDFIENGGTVSEVEGFKILVECESGSFIIHKAFVKRRH